MYGSGLVKGLGITLKHFFGKAITEQYPERKPQLSPRVHGSFDLDWGKCVACGICANSCPNMVIQIDSTRDESKKRVLTGFKMKLDYCLFCGLCVEGCHNGALTFNQEFELACYRREDIALDFSRGSKPEHQASAATGGE